jgi:hypothetical protein
MVEGGRSAQALGTPVPAPVGMNPFRAKKTYSVNILSLAMEAFGSARVGAPPASPTAGVLPEGLGRCARGPRLRAD